jgi:muconolactone delta-isomerase
VSKNKGKKEMCVCVYIDGDHINWKRLMLCTSPESNQRDSYNFTYCSFFKSCWAYTKITIKYKLTRMKFVKQIARMRRRHFANLYFKDLKGNQTSESQAWVGKGQSTTTWRRMGKWMYGSIFFLTSALASQLHAPAALPPRKGPLVSIG